MFSATMRLEGSAVGKNRREEFVDNVLTVSVGQRLTNNFWGSPRRNPPLSAETPKRSINDLTSTNGDQKVEPKAVQACRLSFKPSGSFAASREMR